jgi:hypothetical protein
VNPELTLPLAFLTGVLGAFHCLGMCSGLAGGYFVCRGSGVGAVLSYHGARILVYGVLGSAGALVGRVLVQQGLLGKGQGLLMMLAGLVIVLLGLSRLRPLAGWSNRRAGPTHAPAPRREVAFGVAPPRPGHWFAALAGAGNGLVPCGLTVSIAIAAAATADPVRAGLLMLVFGLGTLPTMALVSLLGTAIGRYTQGRSATLAGITVVVLGLWTLYQGWIFFDIIRGLSN